MIFAVNTGFIVVLVIFGSTDCYANNALTIRADRNVITYAQSPNYPQQQI